MSIIAFRDSLFKRNSGMAAEDCASGLGIILRPREYLFYHSSNKIYSHIFTVIAALPV
jgi:hypothetical protein